MFDIVEHIIPCQFVRERPRATANEHDADLSLAVKQYTPCRPCDPSFQQITIVGCHGNGFPKELYEPMWEDLHHALKQQKIAIANVWIADAAHQGVSGIINEDKLGNDPSIFDHSRDIICLVNQFRSQMIFPIIGIGHSMGGTHLIHAALGHARLFHSLVVIEPVLYDIPSAPHKDRGPVQGAVNRTDQWPSRDAFVAYTKRNKLYASWDPRALERWTQHGVREVFPGGSEVSLTTTKHQEAFTLTRANYISPLPRSRDSKYLHEIDRTLLQHAESPFLLPEPLIVFHNLPFLRPSVLYMFGSLSSFLKQGGMRTRAVERTGAGVLGSGGIANGRVEEISIEDAGHMAPVEKPRIIAQKTAVWIAREVERWKDEQQKLVVEWKGKEGKERRTLDEEFLFYLGLKSATVKGKL